MDRIRELQRRRNAESRLAWDHFSGHRDKVTRLTLTALRGHRQGRLCVLGAGNCNDLDLEALLQSGAEIHLADLDGEALALATERQGLSGHGSIHLQGGLDLAQGVEPPPALAQAPFDVVLSSCLLTQLIEPVIDAMGNESAILPDTLQALRRGHLGLMLDLLAPGGAALVVSDLVASDSVPGLADTPAAAVNDLMTRLIQEHNFFSGANPFALLTDLRDDPGLRDRVDKVAMIEPWIWRFSAARSFLVYAIALHRSGN